jgi:hypothetical protein
MYLHDGTRVVTGKRRYQVPEGSCIEIDMCTSPRALTGQQLRYHAACIHESEMRTKLALHQASLHRFSPYNHTPNKEAERLIITGRIIVAQEQLTTESHHSMSYETQY